jgi:hypothetical protein
MARTRTGVRAASVVLAAATGAQAGTVGFSAYSNNSGTSASIVTSAVLSADGSSFTIELNNGSSQGAITDFYLETGAALAALNSPVIANGTGVAFSPGAAPPSPNNVHNAGDGAWGGNFFSMDSDSPGVTANGVQNGEWVKVTFSHDGSFSLAALESAIAAHDIRLVIHFQGWQGGSSEWLSSAAVIPLPPAAWAASGVLGVLIGVRSVRRAHRRG